MTIRISILVLFCIILASCANNIAPKNSFGIGTTCDYDRTLVLGLDETQFDQNFAGGWRALASKPGCNLAAADLLRDYRKAHGNETGILYWHEAQLRALAGQSESAISLMARSRKPADADRGGWNPYVDATIAFLRKDRQALNDARLKLIAVQPPTSNDLRPLDDGFVEVRMEDGRMMKIRWPPNIDVVDGLLQCFDKPYEVAYGSECRLHAN